MSNKFFNQFNLFLLLSFVVNICIMSLEIVAGRLIAPHVGVSLYTWTTIIGVVLSGISIGSYFGGFMADKWASKELLGKMLILSGLAAFFILPAAYWLPALTKSWNTSLIFDIIFFSLVLFLIPCLLMGSISPIIAKLAIKDTSRTGQTIGTIYAAGTVGSIVGTFATGFFLISHFGTFSIVFSIGLTLGFLGLFLSSTNPQKAKERTSLKVFICLFAIICFDALRASGALKGVCTKESDYYCIRIAEFTLKEICKTDNCKNDSLCREFNNNKSNLNPNSPVRLLKEDNVIQSYNLVQEGSKMIHDYEHVYNQGLKYSLAKEPKSKHPKVAFIGGGGYTLPIYLDKTYPKIKIDVVEIDPQVTKMVYEKMGLKEPSQVISHNEDARVFFNRQPKEKYNLIVGDAFKDITAPYQLITKEFNERVFQWLDEDGLYMVNLIDGKNADYKLTRSFLKTLKQTFPFVEVIKRDDASWKTNTKADPISELSSSTIIASKKKIDKNSWKALEEHRTDYRFSDEKELEKFINHKNLAKVLSDDYAPVEQMTAPNNFRQK